jgi:predicted nucleic acid-binding protein
MKIFFDTNVLLDVILERGDISSSAKSISYSETLGHELSISVLSIANMAYILRHVLKGRAFESQIEDIKSTMTIEPMNEDTVTAAISLHANDFEDALQYACAIQADCDIIITSNKKDFKFSRLPIFSPKEFLENFIPTNK